MRVAGGRAGGRGASGGVRAARGVGGVALAFSTSNRGAGISACSSALNSGCRSAAYPGLATNRPFQVVDTAFELMGLAKVLGFEAEGEARRGEAREG